MHSSAKVQLESCKAEKPFLRFNLIGFEEDVRLMAIVDHALSEKVGQGCEIPFQTCIANQEGKPAVPNSDIRHDVVEGLQICITR